MPTEGYWINPEGEFKEVPDHFDYLRDNHALFGFSSEEAVSWKRTDREEVLKEAIKKGWIRVRGHREYTTFEIPELNNETGWAIKNFLQQTGAWENETVEVHEIAPAKPRRWRETAGYFMEEKHMALGSPDRRSRISYVSPELAEAVMNEDLLKGHGFKPSGPPQVYKIGESPSLGNKRVKRPREESGEPNLVGSILLGLDSGFGAKETFDPKEIRERAMQFFPKGGTMVVQLGWFEGTPEDSVRITIENSEMGLSDEEFLVRYEEMASDIADKYRQKKVWVDFYRGDERVDAFSLDWEG